MDRRTEILRHIGKEQRGIEIGAYFNALTPRRLGFNCITLDVFDTDELKRRAAQDPNVSSEQADTIEDVDIVGSATEIHELVKEKFGTERFDYIVSSHNFEHLSNPIKFLNGCERILKPDGILSMAIPDRRYCFDYYRPATSLPEWLEAFNEDRRQPTATQILYHYSLNSELLGKGTWSSDSFFDFPRSSCALDRQYELWQQRVKAVSNAYQDVHCSVFTPSSFELIMTELNYLNLSGMDLFDRSGPHGCEFYVHLRNGKMATNPATFHDRRDGLLRQMITECGELPNNSRLLGSSRRSGRPPKFIRSLNKRLDSVRRILHRA